MREVLTTMTETFASLYAPGLKPVFSEKAREELARGGEAAVCARGYADLGKPDFALAFLLLAAIAEADKYETLAHAYERRAVLAEEKATALTAQFRQQF